LERVQSKLVCSSSTHWKPCFQSLEAEQTKLLCSLSDVCTCGYLPIAVVKWLAGSYKNHKKEEFSLPFMVFFVILQAK